MTDNVIELGSIKRELKAQITSKEQKALDVGITAFNEAIKDADGFVTIIFKKDDTLGLNSGLLWGGDLDLIKTIGCLGVIKTELAAIVLEASEMNYDV